MEEVEGKEKNCLISHYKVSRPVLPDSFPVTYHFKMLGAFKNALQLSKLYITGASLTVHSNTSTQLPCCTVNYSMLLCYFMGESDHGQVCPLKIPLDLAQWWQGVGTAGTPAPQKNKSNTVDSSRWFTRVEAAARNAFDSPPADPPTLSHRSLTTPPSWSPSVELSRPPPAPPGGGMWTRVMEMDGSLLCQRGGTDGLLPKRPSASLHQSRSDSRRPLQ